MERMNVTRVETDHGSRIEPPLNDHWSQFKKLQWWAAIARMDSGIEVDVVPADIRTKVGPFWVREQGLYSYQMPGSSGGGMSAESMRTWLLGLASGAQAVRNA